MVSMGKNISIDDAFELVKENYSNKKALNKFKEFVSAQKGDINNIPIEENIIEIYSDRDGYINDIDTIKLAELCNDLGAGRKTKDETINPKVGIELVKTIYQKVNKNDLLMKVYTTNEIAKNEYLETIVITKELKEETKIVYEIIK
jgi:pyrimidine-nucleoside phosphorylase